MSKAKTYPSHVLTEALDAQGIRHRLMWEIPGPKDTAIAYLSCYLIGHSVCIVQTFEGDGWEAFTPNGINDTEATIADVIARCDKATA